MAKAEQPTVTSVDDLDIIVEADGHVQESLEWILPYVEDEYREFNEFMERSPAPFQELFPLSVCTPAYQYEKMKEDGPDKRSLAIPRRPEFTADMADDHGIDYTIVTGTASLVIPAIRNKTLARGWCNGFNNWIADELDEYEGVKGNIHVAPVDPEHGAKEIEKHADDDNIVGVQFIATGIVPPPGDSKYDPIYEAAERHDLPICMHSGTGPKNFPDQFWWSETYAEDHTYQHPLSQMWNIASMLFNGTMQKFPDLKFVLQEAGIGYVPYIMERLDHAHREYGQDLNLDRRPSEILRENFWWGTQPLGHTAEDPRHMAWMIDLIGTENVMFAADIPHADFDTPEELFDRIRPHFDSDDLRKIMGENAIEVFDL